MRRLQRLRLLPKKGYGIKKNSNDDMIYLHGFQLTGCWKELLSQRPELVHAKHNSARWINYGMSFKIMK